MWDFRGQEVGDLGDRCYLERCSNDENEVYESFVMIDEPFTELIRKVFSEEGYVGLIDLSAKFVSNFYNVAMNTFITPATEIS